MRARVIVVVLVVVVVAAVGLTLQGVAVARQREARVRCLNNLRLHGKAPADAFGLFGQIPKGAPLDLVPGAVPAGTVFVPGRAPDDRLSWIADGLGRMEQTLEPTPELAQQVGVDQAALKRLLTALRQPTSELAAKLDRKAAWDAGPNAEIGQTRLKLFTCPANIPDSPTVTQYVGLAGVGLDAATLPLAAPLSPRAGGFRYDTPTPFHVIQAHDGLDNTLLFAEVSADLGPWMRGGPSTVRGVDDAATARPPVGFGAQFGGNHPEGGGAVGYASGGAKFLSPRISPAVFRAMVTVAGGDAEGRALADD